jgi:hypothetical protein
MNYWHYIVLGVIGIILLLGIKAAFRQDKKIVFPMIVSVFLVSTLLAVFGVFIVDKYTKKVGLYQVKNKRILSIEKIIYRGIVKNEGDFPIGKVKIEIKLVNKGHAIGNVKGGNYYKPSGFFDFFSSGAELWHAKPQTITKEFVVAENLMPGESKSFRVYFDYPPYFRQVADFTKAWGN